MSEKRARNEYTDEQRAHALELIAKKGISAASMELGISRPTLWRWRTQAAGAREPVIAGQPSTDAPVTKPAANRQVAKSWTPSQRAEILEYAAAHGVSAASEKFRASRYSIYAWQRKVERAAAGKDLSPTTGPTQTEIETQRDREILGEWSRHPGLGPSQIRNQLRRKGVKVSVHTTRRVMEDAGYRPPKVKRHAHDQRFEAVRPNHLWHMDFLHRNINKSSVFTLVILDDYSRFAVGSGVDDAERAKLVIGTFEAAVARHGRPERVIHDKGSTRSGRLLVVEGHLPVHGDVDRA